MQATLKFRQVFNFAQPARRLSLLGRVYSVKGKSLSRSGWAGGDQDEAGDFCEWSCERACVCLASCDGGDIGSSGSEPVESIPRYVESSSRQHDYHANSGCCAPKFATGQAFTESLRPARTS